MIIGIQENKRDTKDTIKPLKLEKEKRSYMHEYPLVDPIQQVYSSIWNP